jgi:CubicO group peptidase (beta-lactamase class C family)
MLIYRHISRAVRCEGLRRPSARAVRGIFAASATIVLGASGAPVAYGQQPTPRIDEPQLALAIHTYFDPLAVSHDLSGVIRIERGSKVTEAWFGYADWSRRTAITRETEFGAGSIAKSMIATVIARLARERRLDTGATVSRYLPDYRHGGQMTVGQVLQHTAGLPRSVPEADRDAVNRNGLIAWLNAHPPAASGGKSVYSNVGYDLLSLIAARAGGAPFDSLVRRIVFDPLRLSHSHFSSTTRTPHSALTHVPGGRADDVRIAPVTQLPVAGGLFATSSDLARWGRAVRDSEIVNLRESDGSLAGSVYVKTIAEHRALWMQGTIPGGGAVVTTFSDTDVVVVVALNLGTYPLFNSEMVASDIAFGITPRPAPIRLPASSLAAEHRAMVGEYNIPGIGRIRIHEANGEMRVALLELDDDQALTPANDGRLLWRAFNFTFAARRDPAGVVNGLRVRLHMVHDTVGDSEVDKLP